MFMPPDIDPRLPLTPLTMAILLALAEEDRHGYALMQSVEAQTEGALKPGTGSLYAALQRLLEDGLIVESPDPPEPGDSRRGKVYRITGEGEELARAEAARMLRVLQVADRRRLAPEGLPLPDAGASGV